MGCITQHFCGEGIVEEASGLWLSLFTSMPTLLSAPGFNDSKWNSEVNIINMLKAALA